MKKRIFSLIICLTLLLGLTACGEGEFTPSQKAFDTNAVSSTLTDGEVVAQDSNGKYSIVYAADSASVNLVDNESGIRWDLCPKSEGEVQYNAFGIPITSEHDFVRSAIEVGFMNPGIKGGGGSNQSAFSAYDSVDQGRVVVKKIDNGVTIEYYFDGQKIMVPVDYVLEDGYLSISVDSTKIQEDYYRVTFVSLAPFLTSVQNDTEDAYLFMPSGSGALLNVNSHTQQGVKYNAFVYGDDFTMEDKYIPSEEKSVRMPVYGYKSGDKGGFVIIDNAAETAQLRTIIGSTDYKFSTIYSTFMLRGYTYHKSRTFKKTEYGNVYPENMLEGKFSIRFYPLSGENVDYNAMADLYQKYLVDEKGLTKTGEEKAVNVSLIGGTQITKSFLGVPYETVYATTTVDQANSIVKDLSQSIDTLSVKLKGFGASGVDVGKIGGDFTVNSSIGSDKKLTTLAKLCEDSGVELYYDYDLVRFNSSGNGFSHYSDSVMNSGILKAEQYITDKANRSNLTEQAYRLLRPISFVDAVSNALNQNAKWNIGGVSLETLTSYCYSDYTDPHATVDLNARYGFTAKVVESLSKVKESKQKLMASDANDYAAMLSSLVVDAPVTSDNGYAFSEDVPFYSMVFKGYVPMTSESINLAIEPKTILLGAVESGMGLNYTLTNNWENTLIDAYYPYFFSTKYENVKEDIVSAYNDLADYYESINGAKIVSSSIIDSGVHCTVFDNDVTVYVNYNYNAVTTPAGECAAQHYIITTGGAEYED